MLNSSQIHFIVTCHRVSDESRGLRGIGRFSRTTFDIIIVFHKIVKRSQISLCCRPHPRPVSLCSLYTQVRSMFSIFIVTRRFHRSMRKKKGGHYFLSVVTNETRMSRTVFLGCSSCPRRRKSPRWPVFTTINWRLYLNGLSSCLSGKNILDL